MGRRQREEGDLSCPEAQEQESHNKRTKLLGGVTTGWGGFLKKLHSLLDRSAEEKSLSWLGDGSSFVVHQAEEFNIETQLGLRACSLHQVLEALGFKHFEEVQSSFTVYSHDCFVRGNPSRIEQILSHTTLPSRCEQELAMPSVAYSSELKPLEVRLRNSMSWEVTVALDTAMWNASESAPIDFRPDALSWREMLEETDRWSSDTEMESPLWWSQQSDFSSICTDDLSDMDALSQISAYYA